MDATKELEQLLGHPVKDPLLTSHSILPLADELSRRPSEERDRLISFLAFVFEHPEEFCDGWTRVVAVKTAVALLPSTQQMIEAAIGRRRDADDYELHFSLFCFLDQVPELPDTGDLKARVPQLLLKYLCEVPADTACAAWMAGNLMGDDWNVDEGFAVLVEAIEKARYVAGRSGAASGLGSLYSRLDPDRAAETIKILQRVARHDRSKNVQASASVALGLIRRRSSARGSGRSSPAG